MITKPGWYVFHNSYSFSIFQVFEYFPKRECWSFNTLYSRRGESKSIKDEELIFKESTYNEKSEPILEYKDRNRLFDNIFNESDRFIIGDDYI